MVSLIAESFEGGSNGANITTANTQADNVAGTVPKFSNTAASAGSLSAAFVTSSAQSLLRFDHTAGPWAWYVFRVRFSALPAANTYIASMFANAMKVADVRLNTDGTITVRDNNTAVITSTGTVLTTNTWHRIAVRVQPGTASTGLQLKIYLGNANAAPNFTGLGTSSVSGSLDNLRVGVVTAATFSFLMDDVEADSATEPDGYSPPVSTALFDEDFEGGSSGAALSTANTGASLILGAAPTFSTTHHGTGALAAQAAATSGTSAVQFQHEATDEAWYVWRVRLSALPEVSTYLASVLADGAKCADLRINADGTLTVRDNNAVALTSTGTTLTTGAWHRLALRVVPGESLQLKIYLGDGTTADFSGAGVSTRPAPVDRVRFGVVASGTLTYLIDSIEADTATEPDGGTDPTPPVVTTLINEVFEGGSNGAAIGTGNSQADAVVGTAPTFTTNAVQGGLAAHFSPAAAQSLLRFDHPAAAHPWYSWYLFLPALPAANTYIAAWFTASNTTKVADLRIDTNGALVLRDNNAVAVTSTALLTAGAWHRVALCITPGGELRMRLYVGPNRNNATPSFEGVGTSTVSGDIDTLRIGVTTAATLAIDIDRLLANTATEPDGLPPVTTPVYFYEDPTLGWVDFTESLSYEHPTRGWELIDPTY